MANLSTQNIGTNFKGMLNLGSTINTPLSTTLQAITDGDGNTTPLQLATNRIALGTSTGTSLLNFPDAGTTAADGIQFGTGNSIYRFGTNILGISGSLYTGNLIQIGGQSSTVGRLEFFSSNVYLTRTAASGIEIGSSGTDGIILKPTYSVNITPSTLTGSSATSALSISQTWNTTGNPTAIFANITNTASGASANLMDLQIGGATIFKVDKNAIITTGASNLGFIHNGTVTFTTASSQHIRSNSSGTNIGTGVLVASARLSVESTTQGFLPPRMTTTQVNAIATPAEGLVVFNTTISHLCAYQSGAWVKMSHSPM